MIQVLVVEDVDRKFADVASSISESVSLPHNIVRASNVNDAEEAIQSLPWSLLVLDVSMDIVPHSGGPAHAEHATLGGLDVIERMFLFEIAVPTIILTGFDSFRSGASQTAEILGIEDIEARAKDRIPDSFIACIRYGAPSWRSKFVQAIGVIGLS